MSGCNQQLHNCDYDPSPRIAKYPIGVAFVHVRVSFGQRFILGADGSLPYNLVMCMQV
jgi:hypothetical protein